MDPQVTYEQLTVGTNQTFVRPIYKVGNKRYYAKLFDSFVLPARQEPGFTLMLLWVPDLTDPEL
jgi:hypothetical protein